jgi:hypothetical protein
MHLLLLELQRQDKADSIGCGWQAGQAKQLQQLHSITAAAMLH